MTSSGKPPLDDQPRGSSWNASGNGAATAGDGNTADLGTDPPTPRQPEEGKPIYGAGVPYGGDDHTEEIDPVALDAPFTSDEQSFASEARKRSTEAAASALQAAPVTPPPPPTASRQAPATPQRDGDHRLRDNELKAPVTQLALSDLFDSTPPPAFMEPPDPAAFSSSRPPPAASPAVQPPANASGPVVALPSINIGGTANKVSRTPSPPSAAVAKTESTPPQRRSFPTLESAGKPAAAKDSPSKRPPPVTPTNKPDPIGHELPGHELPGHEARDGEAARDAASREAVAAEVPRFPSDVPTSRPPDVAFSTGRPSSPPSSRPAARNGAELPEARSLQSAVAMPPPSVQIGQAPLPSIMLGADVEAEPDISARRAQRAGRATVRIELPANFGQPGSPLPGARTAVATTQQPVAWPAGQLAGLPSLSSRKVLWAVGAVLLAVILFLALRSRSGSLVVTALGPGNRPVDDVEIFVDGRPLCKAISPCRIEGLTAGVHTLRATAPELASTGEQVVEIKAGEEATFNLDLVAVTPPEVKAGNLRISAGERDLTLFVDGKRVGKLPQTVSGLSGGKHWIKLDAEDGSAPIEKAVTIVPGETIETDPKPARRDKALITIRLSPGSEGASVTLDDAFLLDFPAELELEPNSVHTLTATKPGFEELTMDVRVEEGESEKLIEVALTPLEAAPPPRKSRAKAARKPAAPKAASTTADATQGLLNISSVPPSQIILNGRPLGSTPKTGVAVPGDSLQTIVFVHPKMGRRRAQKFVPAGKERTVSIRF